MSTHSIKLLPAKFTRTDIMSIIVVAILGSFAFGIVMSLTMGNVLLVAIPGMYGFTEISMTLAVFIGWVIHISHGTGLGLVYGLLVHLLPIQNQTIRNGIVFGTIYGFLLWLILATFLMPFWVGLTTPMNPPVPDYQLWSLFGHILYGITLGILIPVYQRY